MITTLLRPGAPVTQVARLGFDDGWLLLPPTFLNLGMPVVVADRAHIGDPSSYGLQPFGHCDPEVPLPRTRLVVGSCGNLIDIRARSTTEILATTWLHDRARPRLTRYPIAVLIIGSTYELQSSWAALWTMSIGRAKITNYEESNESA